MHTTCAKEISLKNLDGIVIFQDIVRVGFWGSYIPGIPSMTVVSTMLIVRK
jgi:hypothetical protein